MTAPAAYLKISTDYTNDLGGLCWSLQGDAIETSSGQTFALLPEFLAFFGGYASRGPLIHIAHILHFLHLLKGRSTRHPEFASLAQAWRDAGRPARTAGAFAARLCVMVPSLASVVSFDEVCFALEAL